MSEVHVSQDHNIKTISYILVYIFLIFYDWDFLEVYQTLFSSLIGILWKT